MTSDFPVESGSWAKAGSEYVIKLTNNNDATNPTMTLLFNTYSLKNIQLIFRRLPDNNVYKQDT